MLFQSPRLKPCATFCKACLMLKLPTIFTHTVHTSFIHSHMKLIRTRCQRPSTPLRATFTNEWSRVLVWMKMSGSLAMLCRRFNTRQMERQVIGCQENQAYMLSLQRLAVKQLKREPSLSKSRTRYATQSSLTSLGSINQCSQSLILSNAALYLILQSRCHRMRKIRQSRYFQLLHAKIAVCKSLKLNITNLSKLHKYRTIVIQLMFYLLMKNKLQISIVTKRANVRLSFQAQNLNKVHR